ncbi:HDIG domain-containing metalloprotein [Blattabacterium cuenoti]|uniref:HDIG domain-containing metalloprotein n=1 Tax=Blattabacterium cuenoti TaxID=1653831 RepID=UPI00163B89AA|nr:HDIG domain-containing metalloprotein [Blattabacterium cuenoti]
MANFLKAYKSIIDKILVTIIAILLLTFFFPKKEIFKYEFSKGKIWSYGDLFSPFNFFILKNHKDIKSEILNLKKNKDLFYIKDEKIVKNIKKKFKKNSFIKKNKHYSIILKKIIRSIYKYGYIDHNNFSKKNNINVIFLKKNEKWIPILYKKIKNYNTVNNIIENKLNKKNYNNKIFKKILKKLIIPNLFYSPYCTKFFLDKKIKSIKNIKFSFIKGDIIIVKNEVINNKKFEILSSFKKEYEKKIWNKNKYYGLIIGYFLIISMIFYLFIFYLFCFQKKIFQNNRKTNFLIINILLISLITILILRYHSKILYIIPFSILPISIRAFFNFNLSIIIHLITILLLSLITPNSLEFIFLQITTGFIVLLTKKNIYNKMANLFIAVVKITITYIITFISITLIREGSLEKTSLYTFYLFFFSGVLTLFVHPLIFLFEKLLNLTSDISLLELSDTNTPILRLLSKKAPGTLQHVLTVANIAEEAAVTIEANSLLVKIGSIYHDIGKIKNSKFFIENQQNKINPHEKLSPKKSAKIILNHVSIGIELAKKYHLPDAITDFIRTHHGNSIVYYFYKKQQEKFPNIKIDKKQFQYSGPKPFSKETAIVMIADSVEAASKSIKNPSSKDLENLVENIVNKQKKENQFSNTDITLKEIEKVKEVIKKKLINIYHTRIVYTKK